MRKGTLLLLWHWCKQPWGVSVPLSSRIPTPGSAIAQFDRMRKGWTHDGTQSMSRTTCTTRTALMLSRPALLTTRTRVGLEGWRRVLPPEPHYKPLRGRWGVLPDGPLPDLVVAEHADPLLVAMLCADLLRRGRLLDARVPVLIGERDDA